MKYPTFATLEEACAAVGIDPRPQNGRGFIPANVSNDRNGRGDGRIRFYPDGAGGFVENWKTGEKAVFLYDYKGGGARLSREEIEERQAKARERQAKAAQETAEKQAAVAVLAAAILDVSKPSSNHPYLVRKRVQGIPGAPAREIDRDAAQALINAARIPYLDGGPQYLGRLTRRLLLVPVSDELGKVWTLQMIDEEGRAGGKVLLKGGRVQGCAWRPEGFSAAADTVKPIGIAEGVATALSVRALYGLPCFAGMFAGNLPPAAIALSRAFPQATLWLCADRDGNGVGERAAREAALYVPRSRLFVCPELSPEEQARFKALTGSDKATDYNDLLMARN